MTFLEFQSYFCQKKSLEIVILVPDFSITVRHGFRDGPVPVTKTSGAEFEFEGYFVKKN